MKTATKILNIFYCITVLLYIIDSLTAVDIKVQFFKTFIYWGFLIETPILLFWNLLIIKSKKKRLIGTIYPIFILTYILAINPCSILSNKETWKTQNIIYQNTHFKSKRIEFQMQDIGALGYNKRTVEVFYLTPLFTISRQVPSNIDNKVEWEKVDIEVNELKIKYP